jgi:hypothetical protein
MKAVKLIGILLIGVVLSFTLQSNNSGVDYSKANLRYTPNEAFGFGEKLEYKVGYKFITAGTGYFWIKPNPVKMNGRDCYDVNFQVNSLPSLEMLYRVKDNYRSLVDVNSLTPWAFEQRIRENNYKKDFRATFDQVKNKAYADNKTYSVPENVHDVVSALYYVRTMDFSKWKKNDVIYLKNFFEDSTYTLGVKYLGKEEVEVEAGKFRCVIVEPLVVKGGLFKNEGRILIWMTDDERKIPVKVGTKIVIGFVGAELTKYSGVRGQIKAKLN